MLSKPIITILCEYHSNERISIDQIEIISIMERLLWYFFTGKEKVISVQSFRNIGINQILLRRGFPLFEHRILDICDGKCHWVYWQKNNKDSIMPSFFTFVEDQRQPLFRQRIEIEGTIDRMAVYSPNEQLEAKDVHGLRHNMDQIIPLVLNFFLNEIKGIVFCLLLFLNIFLRAPLLDRIIAKVEKEISKLDLSEANVHIQFEDLKWMKPYSFFQSVQAMEFVLHYGNFKFPIRDDTYHVEDFISETFDLRAFGQDEAKKIFKQQNYRNFTFTAVWERISKYGKLTRWDEQEPKSRISSFFEYHQIHWMLSPGQAYKGRFLRKLDLTKRKPEVPQYNASTQSYEIPKKSIAAHPFDNNEIIPPYTGEFSSFQRRWDIIKAEMGKILQQIYDKCNHPNSTRINMEYILANIDPSEEHLDLFLVCFCIANARSGKRPTVSFQRREAGKCLPLSQTNP
jgi:hypothetical protein